MKRPPSARKSPPKRRGARKAIRISVHSEKQISALVARFRLTGPILTYRDVRAALNRKYGLRLSLGTVYRLGRGHEPVSVETRRALGLPAYAPAPVCARCGVVHLRRRCPPPARDHDYDRWRAANAERLAAMVAWAEQQALDR